MRIRRLLSIMLCTCVGIGGVPLAGLPAAAQAGDITLEMEDIYTGGEGEVRAGGEGFSGGFVFVNVVSGSGVGKTLDFTLTVPKAGIYDLSITDKDNVDRGIYTASIDGVPITTVDFYNAETGFFTHSLGRISLTSTTARLTFTCVGSNEASTGKYGLAADFITLSPVTTETDGVIISTGDKAYSELEGRWSAGAGETARVTEDEEASAMWASYPPESTLASPRYDIYAYIPAEGNGRAVYTISTLGGRWMTSLDQSTVSDGWYKLATVAAAAETSISMTVANPDGGKIAADCMKIMISWVSTVLVACAPPFRMFRRRHRVCAGKPDRL